MKAKKFYKNDISVSNEYIVFESPSYENENLIYVGAPSGEDRALVRSYFFKELDRLNIDILTTNFVLVKVKKQHYIVTEVVYNGEFLSFDKELDAHDFILLSNELFLVFIKKPSFVGNLVLNVNFYDFQPHILFVNEFTYKNFTSNPSSKITSSSLYVSGIAGFDKKGNVVYCGRFSQPVLLNEAYVFLQKILIPTYSVVPSVRGEFGFSGYSNVNIFLNFPNISSSDVSISLYSPDIEDFAGSSINLYAPDITDEEDINIIIDFGFVFSADDTFAVNLHDEVQGEVGIINSLNNYRQISTTSIKYGGVATENMYVYYLDYYNNSNTLSIYKFDVTNLTRELFLTFSNQNSQTFSSLQFDFENRIFFVLADNGLYYISLSNPPFVTFSTQFGTNGKYLSFYIQSGSWARGYLLYTDQTPGIKRASYSISPPYVSPPSTYILNTLSNLSFFDTPRFYERVYYITQSNSLGLLKVDYTEGIIFSTSATMSAIVRTYDETSTAVSFQSGSEFFIYKVTEELTEPNTFSVSISFVGSVPKFVREIKQVINSMPFSEFEFLTTLSTYDAIVFWGHSPNFVLGFQMFSSENLENTSPNFLMRENTFNNNNITYNTNPQSSIFTTINANFEII